MLLYSKFANSFCLLEDKASGSYDTARTTRIIPRKQMFLDSTDINRGNLLLKFLKNYSRRDQLYESCWVITRSFIGFWLVLGNIYSNE